MIFKGKENVVENPTFGDVVVFDDNSLALITEMGRGEVTLVFLSNGYLSYDFIHDSLDDLVNCIRLNHSKARFIKSSNIEIHEL